MKSLGERLQEAREAAGFKEKHVAEYLGVSQATISAWENNTRNINSGTLYKLSALYGCPEMFFSPTKEIELKPVAIALRGKVDVFRDDLEVIASVKKLALNLRKIDRILGG